MIEESKTAHELEYNGGALIRRRDIVLVGVLSVCLNVTLLIFIGYGYPNYLRDYRTNVNPDAHHYVRLGENFWLKGVYSRESALPYRPDINRPPIYPLLAGGINVLFGSIWPLYILQVIVSSITSVFVYLLTTERFGPRVGLVAGFFCASDLMLAILNFQAMSETSFVFFSTLAILLWTRVVEKVRVTHHDVRTYVLIGVVLAVGILVRPSGLYVPLLLGVLGIAITFVRKHRQNFVATAAMVLTAYLLVFPWIARNHAVYGLWRLTTLDSLNLAYYVGAGVYQVEFGIDSIQEAQNRVATDYNLVPATKAHNFWLANEPISVMNEKWRNAAWDIFLKNPSSLLRAIMTGFVVGMVAHNVNDLAQSSGTVWVNPGFANLLKLDFRQFFHRLFRNHWVLSVVFSWQLLYVWVVPVVGGVGVICALRDSSNRIVMLSLLVVAAYYGCTIVLQGISPDARMRAPALPILYLFTAVGAVKSWQFLSAIVKRSIGF